MERQQCIEVIYPELEDKLVVTIMGACAQELYDLGHRDNFFYLQHAMGLASSIGLGLATHLPDERVIVLDGDGSVLMNLGTLTTLARYRPKNLIHIIFDNGSLLSTGGFDSQTTAGITDLATITLRSSPRSSPWARTTMGWISTCPKTRFVSSAISGRRGHCRGTPTRRRLPHA